MTEEDPIAHLDVNIGPPDKSLEMPYESFGQIESVDLASLIVCGGVMVLAAIAPLAAGGTAPGLIFRFARADGTMADGIFLVMEDEQLAGVPKFIDDAVKGAIETAVQQRAVAEGRP